MMAGTIDNGRLTLEEVYRFPNRQIRMGNYIYWDFLALFGEMKTGLRLAAHKGYSIKSIGIDTWGVDFGLIDRQGNLLGNTVCYRDPRTNGLPEELFGHMDISRHYAEAGIQVMPINTLFQLYSIYSHRLCSLCLSRDVTFVGMLFTASISLRSLLSVLGRLLFARTSAG